MPFHKLTYNEKHRFATLHHYGCTFRCPICSYKLRSGAHGTPGYSWPKPARWLKSAAIKSALSQLQANKLYVMGGEPSSAKELPDILRFAYKELGWETRLGHTNGSNLDLPFLQGANVGLKAWDPDVHRAYTGWEKERIFGAFAAAHARGLDLRANVVFVPKLVDIDQVEAIAAWLRELDHSLPLHIMAYIPVPGQPYERPTETQMAEAIARCREHLMTVHASHLTPEEALDLQSRDDRFAVSRVL